MPTEPLPLINALASGFEELAGASPQAMNVVMDGAGAVRRRPGIAPYGPTLPGAPSALYCTERGDIFAVVPASDAAVSPLSVVRLLPTGSTTLAGSMVGSSRPTIVETEMLLVIAAGQDMYKLELPDPTLSPHALQPLGGNPPKASHVVHNSLRLVANDMTIDRTKLRYSSQAAGTTTYAGHEQWSIGAGTAGYFTAEANPDPIVALHENSNELWVFGTRTLQLFSPDLVFRYAPSATMEVGCSAPFSVVKREGEFYWLDHARRFVKSSGRGTDTLSQQLQRLLQSFSRVDDCFGYRVLVGPVDGIAWTFPTQGVTLFMQVDAGWSQWAGWSTVSHNFSPFAVTAHAYDRSTGKNVVGISGGGNASVGELRMGLGTDSVVNGGEIVANVTTGFLNRGTDARKVCRGVRLTFRRGATVTAPELRGHLSWRDAPGPWEPPIPVVLDGMQPVYELRSLGTYRRRQWKYTFSDSAEDLVLCGAEEDFEVTD